MMEEKKMSIDSVSDIEAATTEMATTEAEYLPEKIGLFTWLKKYAVFRGRSCRKEYWFSVLFMSILITLLTTLSMFFLAPKLLEIEKNVNMRADFDRVTSPVEYEKRLADGEYEKRLAEQSEAAAKPFQPISFVVGLALLLPYLALAFRRFQDFGLNGWWGCSISLVMYLLNLFWALGIRGSVMTFLWFLGAGILLIVLGGIPSQSGRNKYGPQPVMFSKKNGLDPKYQHVCAGDQLTCAEPEKAHNAQEEKETAERGEK